MNRALKKADESQRIAADPNTSVFVTANAGSGKTKVLVDRIARLLLEDDSKPSAFLCITYTKAAAAEMQRRLFERLGGWCVAEDDKLAADLAKLGARPESLSKARALFAQALETPGGLKIQTIHAFCERLLARFPLEAGVPPGFDIADESRAAELLGRARAEAALGENAPQEAFQRFAKRLHGDGLDALLNRLAMRRADFHRYAQKHGFGWDAEIRNRHNVRQSADGFSAAFIARQDWKALREAATVLATGGDADRATAQRLIAAIECIGHARDHIEACFNFTFTSSDEPYKKLVSATLKKSHPWLEPLLRRFADECVEARATLNAIERADDAIATLELALMLDREYQRAKTAAGMLDFDDLIENSRRLLQRSDAAPWVLYKLDGGLDHILIDEGQDTSPTQWDLVAPLQNEFFSGAGAREKPRTVFAVGDPKQSIYGFQGADPRRFLSEAQALEKRSRKAKLAFAAPDLLTSFRSSPEILRAVDATFADKQLVTAAPGKHDLTLHLAAREHEAGVVEVWPLAMRPVIQPAIAWDAPVDVETGASVHAQLAKHIARRIKAMIDAGEAVWDKETRALRPMRAGDVLALVRTRGALFRELIKAFKRADLPVAGADRMILHDELAVEDCLALMRVALDPADDLSLACALKGPWCDLDDDNTDLFPLAYGRGRQSLYARLMSDTTAKYEAARVFVREISARSGHDAFAFLSWALETPHAGGPSGWLRVLTRLGAEARDPLEELLQRALKPGAHAAPTLQRFLYDIEIDSGEVKRELEAETGSVRVMTVHGAKGLEAPVVILPDSTGVAQDKPDEGLIFDEAEGPFYSQRKKDDDAKTAAARAAHEASALSEHWRLLYVAMTRARDRLIVCGAQYGNAKAGEAEESWRLSVETALRGMEGVTPCETPTGEGLRLGAPLFAKATDAPAIAAPAPLPAWARTPAPGSRALEVAAPSRIDRIDPALFSPRGDGQKRFRRGRLIHGLLERLPDVASERRAEAAQTWLKKQGATEDEARAYASEALKVISDARFAVLFGPQSRAEAPIVGVAGGKAVRGVVDRLAIDDARVIILDFKTDRPAPTNPDDAPEPYVLQLALYREVLRQIFPGKVVSCALLWTEAPHLMELPESRLQAAFAQFSAG